MFALERIEIWSELRIWLVVGISYWLRLERELVILSNFVVVTIHREYVIDCVCCVRANIDTGKLRCLLLLLMLYSWGH